MSSEYSNLSQAPLGEHIYHLRYCLVGVGLYRCLVNLHLGHSPPDYTSQVRNSSFSVETAEHRRLLPCAQVD